MRWSWLLIDDCCWNEGPNEKFWFCGLNAGLSWEFVRCVDVVSVEKDDLPLDDELLDLALICLMTQKAMMTTTNNPMTIPAIAPPPMPPSSSVLQLSKNII